MPEEVARLFLQMNIFSKPTHESCTRRCTIRAACVKANAIEVLSRTRVPNAHEKPQGRSLTVLDPDCSPDSALVRFFSVRRVRLMQRMVKE